MSHISTSRSLELSTASRNLSNSHYDWATSIDDLHVLPHLLESNESTRVSIKARFVLAYVKKQKCLVGTIASYFIFSIGFYLNYIYFGLAYEESSPPNFLVSCILIYSIYWHIFILVATYLNRDYPQAPYPWHKLRLRFEAFSMVLLTVILVSADVLQLDFMLTICKQASCSNLGYILSIIGRGTLYAAYGYYFIINDQLNFYYKKVMSITFFVKFTADVIFLFFVNIFDPIEVHGDWYRTMESMMAYLEFV